MSSQAPRNLPNMTPPQVPAETIQQILGEIGDDRKANFKAGTLSKFWLVQQRQSCFKKLLFNDEQDIIAFKDLTTSPVCTIPSRIQCEDISFHGLVTMTKRGAAAMSVVLSRIASPRSLTAVIVEGKIPPPVARAARAWSSTLQRLKVSGGTHNPRTFFAMLSVLLHLEALELQDFGFKPVKTRWWRPGCTYVFPPALKTLSVTGDARPFKLFVERVIPSGGFNGVTTLAVQTRFLREDPGLSEMFDAFRSLKTLHTLKLRPIYDPECPDLGRDMEEMFSSKGHPLLKICGLKSLQIDFSDTPAEWALNCLTTCAIFLPRRRTGLSVGIRVPRSLELWDDQGPAVQLEQLLGEVSHPNPLANGASESTLIVKDFPADLPGRFGHAATVCGCPVTFVDAHVFWVVINLGGPPLLC